MAEGYIETIDDIVEIIDAFSKGRKNNTMDNQKENLKAPAHYDNSNGSLYKFCEDHRLNAYEFEVIKRIVRCRKKGEWASDIDKTINVLELYKKEQCEFYKNQIEPINESKN